MQRPSHSQVFVLQLTCVLNPFPAEMVYSQGKKVPLWVKDQAMWDGAKAAAMSAASLKGWWLRLCLQENLGKFSDLISLPLNFWLFFRKEKKKDLLVYMFHLGFFCSCHLWYAKYAKLVIWRVVLITDGVFSVLQSVLLRSLCHGLTLIKS